MTDEDLATIHREIHDLRLLGACSPREQGLMASVDDLVREIRRLRSVSYQAISYLREANPQRADELQRQVNWSPQGPV
jgi:hypothetical protein